MSKKIENDRLTFPNKNEFKLFINRFSILKGQALFKRRIELGLTQHELAGRARLMGIPLSQPAISSAESGYARTTNLTLDKIAEALGGIEELTITFREVPGERK
ncbi:helix-turn-helix transcriptional regulator [Terrilactibacillus sp. S3-3]|nr:helix-turn-helix transcriptional regulator [Terrilactibacillus sp. S3-3]